MKKIVGIMAATAMAASMFAVDFSAGVRMQGDLFNFDAASKTVKVLEEHHENQFYHAPISFAISGDRAGGQLKMSNVLGTTRQVRDNNGKVIYVDEKGNEVPEGTPGAKIKEETIQTVLADAWSIWFKPVDALKVTVGRWSTNLNQEHIGWCNTDSGIESDGYALSFATGAFSADLFLASGNGNPYFVKAGDKDPTLGELYVKAQYAAGFGTINGMFNAINNFKDMRFGAGINVAGLPVGLWANVIGVYANEKFNRIRVEADVSGKVDALGYEVFVAGGYYAAADAGAYNAFTGTEGWHIGGSYYLPKTDAFVGMYAKVTYPIGALGAYVEIKDNNFLAKDFNMVVKPGFTTNVGACAINCAVEATLQKDVKIAVPVEFVVKF